MLHIRLPKELEEELEKVAKATGHSKEYYIRKAIQQYLENRKDYSAVVEALKQNNPHISVEEMMEQLGL